MPFINLPESEEHLRLRDEVQLHYLLSTPAEPTFLHAARSAKQARANASPTVNYLPSRICSSTRPDPRFPILLVFPSECFSVVHLFPHILADADLASRFNILALDPRGHGLTREVPPREGASHKYNLDTKAADCVDFVELFLASVPEVPKAHWKIHAIACGMSGLVATRMAAKMPEQLQSLTIVSPILETEDSFIIESFAECEDLLSEAWERAHSPHEEEALSVRMPGEIIEGFNYRWAGEELLPKHVLSHTFADLFDRMVRRVDGREAAKAWLFNLYFQRKPQADEDRKRVVTDMFVLEGSEHLPYEKPIGQTYKQTFPNIRSFQFEQIQGAPFLLSVQRPILVRNTVKEYLLARPDVSTVEPLVVDLSLDEGFGVQTPRQTASGDEGRTIPLSHSELYQLRQAFAHMNRTSKSSPPSSLPAPAVQVTATTTAPRSRSPLYQHQEAEEDEDEDGGDDDDDDADARSEETALSMSVSTSSPAGGAGKARGPEAVAAAMGGMGISS